MLSRCDRALDRRDKKREELSRGETPEDETLGELTSHFDPPQYREGDCTTTVFFDIKLHVLQTASFFLTFNFALQPVKVAVLHRLERRRKVVDKNNKFKKYTKVKTV